HTRSYGDWSSDVCSSDLVRLIEIERVTGFRRSVEDHSRVSRVSGERIALVRQPGEHLLAARGHRLGPRIDAVHSERDEEMSVRRSEERRVGKECRMRWGH